MTAIPQNAYREAFWRSIQLLPTYVLNDVDPDVRVALFTNDIVPTGESIPADFTAPTYTGYSQITGGGVSNCFIDPATQDWVVTVTSGVLFQPTNEVNLPETAYGYFVVNNDGDKVLWAARFDAPFVFQSSDNALLFVPELRLLLGGLA